MLYHLVDGVQRHNENPDRFGIPSNEEKAAVRLGDYVKLGFEPVDDEADEQCGERMWVEVTKIDGDNFAGKLMNQPFIFAGILHVNMLIEFEKKHIIGFEEKEKNEKPAMYINPEHMTKEEWLHDNADLVMPIGAAPAMRTVGTMIAVCLVDCRTHSAAGVAFNDKEFERMVKPDGRARVWFFAETEKLLQIVPELGKVIAN